MNSKLIIAAIACLGLAACQPSDKGKKEEEKKPAAEHTQGAGAEGAAHPAAPAQPAAPTAPGASYYDNNQNQNMAEQANPAIDTQQETAMAPAAEGESMHVSQQTEAPAEPEAAAQ